MTTFRWSLFLEDDLQHRLISGNCKWCMYSAAWLHWQPRNTKRVNNRLKLVHHTSFLFTSKSCDCFCSTVGLLPRSTGRSSHFTGLPPNELLTEQWLKKLQNEQQSNCLDGLYCRLKHNRGPWRGKIGTGISLILDWENGIYWLGLGFSHWEWDEQL